jgi:hypothetical protein
MGFRTLRLKPGVNLEISPTLNTFQIATCNLIRFYGDMVQKLGGWLQLTSQRFVGICRGLHGWADLVGNAYLGIGTEQRLQVYVNGNIIDITPVVQTDNPAPAFTSANGSNLVVIADGSYTPNIFDWINLTTHVSIGTLVLYGYYQVLGVGSGTYQVNAGASAQSNAGPGGTVATYTTTNGQSNVTVTLANHGLLAMGSYTAGVSTTVATLVISGTYTVVSVTSSSQFVISASGIANASTTASENSGNAQIKYLLPNGNSFLTSPGGWGAGSWGVGPWGVGGGTPVYQPGRQWSLDHFGQYLIASPLAGKIYYWTPPNAAPAVVVANTAPLYNNFVFVIQQAEIIMSLGAEVGGVQQPLLIRWCDPGDFTDWTVSTTNQAGSFSIPQGSALVGGAALGLGAMIWTDEGAWSVQYLGFPLAFGFNPIGQKNGLIAPRAFGVSGSLVMWLSRHQFWQGSIGGGSGVMECPVFDFYWYNVDKTQLIEIHCAVNSIFNEMTWFFPIAPTSPLFNPNASFGYVKYNYGEASDGKDGVWDYGLSQLYQRTAWTDTSPVGNPIGADLAGLLQQHEVGFDANGVAMFESSWQGGFVPLGDGEDYQFSDFLIPEFVTIGDPVFIPNIQTYDYPNGPVTQVVTQLVNNASTYFITYSARGRYMAFGFNGYSLDIGTFWRLGGVRIRVSANGRN